jgi:DNA-binding MarR family transcriptional regulator
MSVVARDMSEFYAELDQLMRASRVLGGVVAESIANVEDEVTLPQLRTLVLVETTRGINAAGVADALGIHPSNATRLIDRLVQAGYLSRSDSSSDRRRIHLTLTRAGGDLVEEVMEYRRRAFERILRRMAAADRRRLAVALATFSAAAEEPEESRLLSRDR